MKRFVAGFSVALLAVFGTAMVAEGFVRNSQGRPSGQASAPLTSEGALLVSLGSGDLYEAARVGEIYSVKTASAGTSFSTAGVSPLGAAGVVWLGLYNPPSSGFNLEVLTVKIAEISGTPGVGTIVYDLGCPGVALTATSFNPTGTLNPAIAGVGLGITQNAATGLPASIMKEIGISNYAPFAAAAAGAINITAIDNINGGIIVPQGCLFAIQPTAAGTTHVAAGEIRYRQAVP